MDAPLELVGGSTEEEDLEDESDERSEYSESDSSIEIYTDRPPTPEPEPSFFNIGTAEKTSTSFTLRIPSAPQVTRTISTPAAPPAGPSLPRAPVLAKSHSNPVGNHTPRGGHGWARAPGSHRGGHSRTGTGRRNPPRSNKRRREGGDDDDHD